MLINLSPQQKKVQPGFRIWNTLVAELRIHSKILFFFIRLKACLKLKRDSFSDKLTLNLKPIGKKVNVNFSIWNSIFSQTKVKPVSCNDLLFKEGVKGGSQKPAKLSLIKTNIK